MAATGTAAPQVSAIRSVLGMFTNPKAVFQQHLMHVPAPVCLLVSCLAFSLFYLQTALDVSQRGWRGVAYIIALTVLGLVVGTVTGTVSGEMTEFYTDPSDAPTPVSGSFGGGVCAGKIIADRDYQDGTSFRFTVDVGSGAASGSTTVSAEPDTVQRQHPGVSRGRQARRAGDALSGRHRGGWEGTRQRARSLGSSSLYRELQLSLLHLGRQASRCQAQGRLRER